MRLLITVQDGIEMAAITLRDDGSVEVIHLDQVRNMKGHLLPPPSRHEGLWRTVERAARWAAQEAEKS